MTDREILESIVKQNRELKKRLKTTSIGFWALVLGYIIIIIYGMTLIVLT